MTDAKDQQENIKTPEAKIPAPEQEVSFEAEQVKSPELQDLKRGDKIVDDELRKEIELMELDEKSKGEAKKRAEKISFLAEDEKVKHLLKIAKEKGVVFAVQVARKMNDPFILDILHDSLAQEGFYKDFSK